MRRTAATTLALTDAECHSSTAARPGHVPHVRLRRRRDRIRGGRLGHRPRRHARPRCYPRHAVGAPSRTCRRSLAHAREPGLPAGVPASGQRRRDRRCDRSREGGRAGDRGRAQPHRASARARPSRERSARKRRIAAGPGARRKGDRGHSLPAAQRGRRGGATRYAAGGAVGTQPGRRHERWPRPRRQRQGRADRARPCRDRGQRSDRRGDPHRARRSPHAPGDGRRDAHLQRGVPGGLPRRIGRRRLARAHATGVRGGASRPPMPGARRRPRRQRQRQRPSPPAVSAGPLPRRAQQAAGRSSPPCRRRSAGRSPSCACC